MSDLIKALKILLKYGDPYYPTDCKHDEMIIVDINPDDVSEGDKIKLHKLGFHVTREFGEPAFVSFRFGSS